MIYTDAILLDTVGTERKLNIFRFARDINIVDLLLSTCVFDIIVVGLVLITVIIIVIATTPWLTIPTMVCGCICIYLRKIYIRTSRSVRRLEGTSK